MNANLSPTLEEASQCLVDALEACKTNTGYVYLPAIASRIAAVQDALARAAIAAATSGVA